METLLNTFSRLMLIRNRMRTPELCHVYKSISIEGSFLYILGEMIRHSGKCIKFTG